MYQNQVNNMDNTFINDEELKVEFCGFHQEYSKDGKNTRYDYMIVETNEEYPQKMAISISDYWYKKLTKYNLRKGVEIVINVSIRSIHGVKNDKEYYITKFNLTKFIINDEFINSVTANLPKYEDVFGNKRIDSLDDMMDITETFFNDLKQFEIKSPMEHKQLLSIIQNKIKDLETAKSQPPIEQPKQSFSAYQFENDHDDLPF